MSNKKYSLWEGVKKPVEYSISLISGLVGGVGLYHGLAEGRKEGWIALAGSLVVMGVLECIGSRERKDLSGNTLEDNTSQVA